MTKTSKASLCRADIESRFRSIIETSDRLLALSSELIPKRDFHLYKIPGLGDREKALAAALFCKLCREYRSVFILGRSGHIQEGEILLRAMYEDVLTLRFLLHPKVRLVALNELSQKKPIDMRGKKPLTRRLRADLYMFRDLSDTIRRIREYRRTPGFKRFGRQHDLTGRERAAEELKKAIGEGWAKDSSKKLAGRSLRDLSASLAMSDAYLTAYAGLSKPAHAQEAHKYVKNVSQYMGLEVWLEPNSREVERLFFVADLLLYNSATLFNKTMRRGKDTELGAISLHLRLKERSSGA